jgi:phage-related minor tail protein
MTNSLDPLSAFDAAFVTAPLASQNLGATKQMLDQITASAEKASKTLATGFGAAAASGRSFNDTLSLVAQSLARIALQSATQALTQGLVGSLGGLFAGAFGASGKVTPFAEGGVVAAPTYFSSGGATGLMGERGAEAVMPLARGADGRLGVVSPNGGARPVSVTVNIAARDAESFRQSEAQISGALARAVARGQRNL